jgi:hypothetical protein
MLPGNLVSVFDAALPGAPGAPAGTVRAHASADLYSQPLYARCGIAGTTRRHRVRLEVVMHGAGRTRISQPPAQLVEQPSSAGLASQGRTPQQTVGRGVQSSSVWSTAEV